MIKPTVGRVVWYYENGEAQVKAGEQPFAALIAHVWGDGMVNLAVFTANGVNQSRTSVNLLQEGDVIPTHSFCTWMPYQVGQAKKNEEPKAEKATVTALPPHQQRVVEEEAELNKKLVALAAFLLTPIYASLPTAEKHRLQVQSSHMASYLAVLRDRIAAF